MDRMARESTYTLERNSHIEEARLLFREQFLQFYL